MDFVVSQKKLTKQELQDVKESDEAMKETFHVDWESKDVVIIPEAIPESELPDYMRNLKNMNETLNSSKEFTTPKYMQDLAVQSKQLKPKQRTFAILPHTVSEPSFEEDGCNQLPPSSNGTKDEIETSDEDGNEDVNAGLRVCICIQGWLWKKSELTTMWAPMREFDPSAEVYSLVWETDALKNLGHCLVKTVSKVVAVQAAKFWLVANGCFSILWGHRQLMDNCSCESKKSGKAIGRNVSRTCTR